MNGIKLQQKTECLYRLQKHQHKILRCVLANNSCSPQLDKHHSIPNRAEPEKLNYICNLSVL